MEARVMQLSSRTRAIMEELTSVLRELVAFQHARFDTSGLQWELQKLERELLNCAPVVGPISDATGYVEVN